MEGGDQRKKRKLAAVEEEEEEEESEEAKMEKFYELIRMSKDIQARMMMINGERLKAEEERMKKKKGISESKRTTSVGGAWNPTFQLEDFMEDGLQVNNICPSSSRINSNRTAAAAGASNSKKDDDKGRGDHNGLDLNLSL